MSKKYFIISDIHGYYNEMITALTKSGYDSDDLKHHLIVIGDLFDRGTQSKEVFQYLYQLNKSKKATVILGNHDNFLIELLDGQYLKAIFNIRYNGTGKTISSLLGKKYKNFTELEGIRDEIIEKYPYLNKWLKSLPYYLEIGDYIFVHGGIDGQNENWMNGEARDFIWSRQYNLEPVEGKTMVVGHTRIATIRYPGINYKSLFLEKPEAFNILFEEQKIFIDAFVEISKLINVLVLEI
ncbi:MAG: fructose-bisphosphatase class III [Candidatus Izimaplasma sp.]|nr:fructose-bisphosphatase class III [Candidatus Izimaplasma bacterium]